MKSALKLALAVGLKNPAALPTNQEEPAAFDTDAAFNYVHRAAAQVTARSSMRGVWETLSRMVAKSFTRWRPHTFRSFLFSLHSTCSFTGTDAL